MLKRKNRWFILTLLLLIFLAACGGSEDAAQDEADSEVEEAAESAPAAEEPAVVSLWIFEGEEGFLPRLEEEFEALFRQCRATARTLQFIDGLVCLQPPALLIG